MPRLQLSLHNLREHFGGERAVQITADRLTTYANARRAEGAALASISAELAALRRAFNLTVRAGRLQSRPHFPTLRVSNARQGFLEEADFHAIIAELPEYLRAPLTFGWLTGWRVRSEVLPMTWAQVDLDAGTARLEQGSTKSGEGREFPIRALPELEQLLLRQREHVRGLERKLGCIIVHVFANNQGRPIVDYAVVAGGTVQSIAVFALAEQVEGVPCFALGYAVIESARGHGLASQTVIKGIDELQNGMRRNGVRQFYVEAVVATSNVSSNKLARRLLCDSPVSGTDAISGEPIFQYLKLLK